MGVPVIFDATHSVQLPSARGPESGGQPEYIEPLARAAAAVGIAGIFVEAHDSPQDALSDGANALTLDLLSGFWTRIRTIDSVVKRWNP